MGNQDEQLQKVLEDYQRRKKLFKLNLRSGSRYFRSEETIRPRVNQHGEIVVNNRKKVNSRGVQSRAALVQRVPIQKVVHGTKKSTGETIAFTFKTNSYRKIAHVRVPK